MAKSLQKILIMLTLMAIPEKINQGHSPKINELENINPIEITEKDITKATYNLIEINQDIFSLERKKDFLLMRLNENISDSIIKTNYKNKLKETEIKLKKYYSEKDSIYKIMKK